MAIGYVLSIILVCQIFWIVMGLEIGEECSYGKNEPGVCKLVNECLQVIIDLKAGRPFFDCKPGSNPDIVCCPVANVQTYSPMISELKCKEYSDAYIREKNQIRIMGGSLGVPAKPREFPHMARLGYGPASSIEYLCGGTLISRRYILTAGHCAVTRNGEPIFVRIGDLIFDDNRDDAHSVTIGVERVTVHPDYSPQFQYHDIALLRLAENTVFNRYVRPACLNSVTQYNQTKAIATGWGVVEWYGESSKHLLKMVLDLLAFNECSSKYVDNRKTPQGLNENQHLCAGSRDDIIDTCEGDSGGPLQVFHEIPEMYNVIGVTFFGKACGIAGTPGVYTGVSNYIDWIESIAFSEG